VFPSGGIIVNINGTLQIRMTRQRDTEKQSRTARIEMAFVGTVESAKRIAILKGLLDRKLSTAIVREDEADEGKPGC
jgi:nucleoid-associated protein YejK